MSELAMPVPSIRARFKAAVERLLPWYDVEAEARRNARTEAIRTRAIGERIKAERVRDAYAAAGHRVERRRSVR